MKVLGLKIIREYSQNHADIKSQLDAWLVEVKARNWTKPDDMKLRYPSASILPDNRVVFNIKGNKYRLDTRVDYTYQIVIIKRIGTHAEYNKWEF